MTTLHPRRRRFAAVALRWARRLVPGGAVVAAGVSATPLLTQGPRTSREVHHQIDGIPRHLDGPPGRLRVMTLNLAHGRSDGFHQVLQSKQRIVTNLSRVARVIDREAPDVVALQEADGPSLWSGQFDHVRFVAAETGFADYVRGEHVVGLRTRYGTALMSRVGLTDARSITFRPSPPTLSKGFVLATVPVPGKPGVAVDVVSVHLDFARQGVRRRQVQELVNTLVERPNPRLILGDFNATWGGEETLQALVDGLELVAWQPDAGDQATFPFNGKRLDWILASPRLSFLDYRVLDDTVSDHRPVVALLALADD
ncbi:MAG: endonuclease/exonuclease/phosphatase family protein [Myxococcales bacterium]|nr:endonuclease/exonuclease/phosphatase family protein [Myxococcales bacterium]MCB9523630.1 endonuclease/exonuclease/phosphatase family protein [Myxococcales bacterium]